MDVSVFNNDGCATHDWVYYKIEKFAGSAGQ